MTWQLCRPHRGGAPIPYAPVQKMSYHTWQDETGEAYGSFQTFYADQGDCADLAKAEIAAGVPAEDRITYQPGWYWWACFPGCLPDGEPMGPFESEQAAIEAANQC